MAGVIVETKEIDSHFDNWNTAELKKIATGKNYPVESRRLAGKKLVEYYAKNEGLHQLALMFIGSGHLNNLREEVKLFAFGEAKLVFGEENVAEALFEAAFYSVGVENANYPYRIAKAMCREEKLFSPILEAALRAVKAKDRSEEDHALLLNAMKVCNAYFDGKRAGILRNLLYAKSDSFAESLVSLEQAHAALIELESACTRIENLMRGFPPFEPISRMLATNVSFIKEKDEERCQLQAKIMCKNALAMEKEEMRIIAKASMKKTSADRRESRAAMKAATGRILLRA